MRRAAVLLAFVAGCTFDLPLFCGDGRIDAAEECDDANDIDGDGCDSNCTRSRCGDGIFDSGEQCDDGNTTSGDGCDSNCKFTGCGNGIATESEECDDGNFSNSDFCILNCHLARCGDGYVSLSLGEECDDGNAVTEACVYGSSFCSVCDAACHIVAGAISFCGDGVRQAANETCDDGNGSSCGTCNASCSTTQPGGNCASGIGCRFSGDCASGVCLSTKVCQ